MPEPTEDQIAKMKVIVAKHIEGFKALPEEVRNKYAAEKAKDEAIPMEQREDFVKIGEIFKACDANNDGVLDKTEFAEFQKMLFAHRDAKYGGHVHPDEAQEQAWCEIAFSVSEPHDSLTLEDLAWMGKLSEIASKS